MCLLILSQWCVLVLITFGDPHSEIHVSILRQLNCSKKLIEKVQERKLLREKLQNWCKTYDVNSLQSQRKGEMFYSVLVNKRYEKKIYHVTKIPDGCTI